MSDDQLSKEELAELAERLRGEFLAHIENWEDGDDQIRREGRVATVEIWLPIFKDAFHDNRGPRGRTGVWKARLAQAEQGRQRVAIAGALRSQVENASRTQIIDYDAFQDEHMRRLKRR